MTRRLAALDAWLLAWPRAGRCAAIALTIAVMIALSLPKVPRPFIDYASLPLLRHIPQPATYGTDTIADMYESKVVLNDVFDMYTKVKVDQTPLEAQTWSKAASSPYPPAVLLAEAGLSAIGEHVGVGLYGIVLLLAVAFIGLSLWYCLRTRWYVFPLLYLNFVYFSERFVFVQDGSYLVMLLVVMTALLLARAGRGACHGLMALAIAMKLSPLAYTMNLPVMTRRSRIVFVAILAAGLALPYVVWDNYLYIYSFNDGLKGRWYSTIVAAAIAVPFAYALWRVQQRRGFDLEDRIGWGLVPFALFLGWKMNVARHLLIVLLVPDKRGLRSACTAVGLALPVLLPGLIRFNSALPITTALLVAVLAWYWRTPGAERISESS